MFFQLISSLVALAASVYSIVAGPTLPSRIGLGVASVLIIISLFLNLKRYRSIKKGDPDDGGEDA